MSEVAKRTITEKELKKYLQRKGFKEVNKAENLNNWYKKAAESPGCLKETQEKYSKKS